MNKKEKQRIMIFARQAFRKFYCDNYQFLSESEYKPGKRTYRNLLSLNKMMELYTISNEDYIIKKDAIVQTGWKGSSSYVQHERIITNFDLSDTSWRDRDRAVLLLNDNGVKLRNQYRKYKNENPTIELMELTSLPDFARKYLVNEIKNTDSTNMTLWKNTIISALYLYCELGYMPSYTKSTDHPSEEEERALINCCNYAKNSLLMDLTYLQQPIAMLRNLNLLDESKRLTNDGYKLLENMRMFSEVKSSINDFEEIMGDEIDNIEDILDSKVLLEKVDAPERKRRKSKVLNKGISGPRNRDFDKKNKENKMTGDLGEKLVLDYEREKLRMQSISDVEDKVFLTSSKKDEYGNAYPCDIISFDPSTGNSVFIEVKTTRMGAETPFYISAEEVQFSIDNESNYKLYRVFNALANRNPQFYETRGKVEDNFLLEKERYIASRYKND